MAKVKMNIKEAVDSAAIIPVETTEETVKELKKVKVCKCNLLRLRESASTDAEVLEVIPVNTELTVLKNVDEKWSKVKLESGRTGFVMNNFIC